MKSSKSSGRLKNLPELFCLAIFANLFQKLGFSNRVISFLIWQQPGQFIFQNV